MHAKTVTPEAMTALGLILVVFVVALCELALRYWPEITGWLGELQ